MKNLKGSLQRRQHGLSYTQSHWCPAEGEEEAGGWYPAAKDRVRTPRAPQWELTERPRSAAKAGYTRASYRLKHDSAAANSRDV